MRWRAVLPIRAGNITDQLDGKGYWFNVLCLVFYFTTISAMSDTPY